MPGGNEQALMQKIQQALAKWKSAKAPDAPAGDLAADMDAARPQQQATEAAQRNRFDQARAALVPPNSPAYGQARYQGPEQEQVANADPQARGGGPAIDIHPLLRPQAPPPQEAQFAVRPGGEAVGMRPVLRNAAGLGSTIQQAEGPRPAVEPQFARRPAVVEASIDIQPVVRNAQGEGKAVQQSEGVSSKEAFADRAKRALNKDDELEAYTRPRTARRPASQEKK